ncbi:MAG: hypothetical protein ABJA67_01970, partial [Chthonomonadales bacterium]
LWSNTPALLVRRKIYTTAEYPSVSSLRLNYFSGGFPEMRDRVVGREVNPATSNNPIIHSPGHYTRRLYAGVKESVENIRIFMK